MISKLCVICILKGCVFGEETQTRQCKFPVSWSEVKQLWCIAEGICHGFEAWGGYQSNSGSHRKWPRRRRKCAHWNCRESDSKNQNRGSKAPDAKSESGLWAVCARHNTAHSSGSVLVTRQRMFLFHSTPLSNIFNVSYGTSVGATPGRGWILSKSRLPQ